MAGLLQVLAGQEAGHTAGLTAACLLPGAQAGQFLQERTFSGLQQPEMGEPGSGPPGPSMGNTSWALLYFHWQGPHPSPPPSEPL